MSQGELVVLPFLVGCLSGEVLYVLNQRLASQEVVEGKAWLFFGDVIRTLFDTTFISQLVERQPVYPISAVKSIFERALKSPVIQMNQHSLDKLFDMSMMSVKSQIATCASHEEVIQVTLNHVFELRQVCASNETHLLDKFVLTIVKISKNLTPADFAKLRQSLLTYLSGKREKVSVLLKSKTQGEDGCLIARPGGYLPPGVTQIPGSVRLVQQNKSFQLLPPGKATELWWVLPEPFTVRKPFTSILYSTVGLSQVKLKEMRHAQAATTPAEPGSALTQNVPIKPVIEQVSRAPSLPVAPVPIIIEISAPEQKMELNAFAAALRKARAPRQLSSSANQWNEAELEADKATAARPGKLSGSDILELMDALK